MSTETKTYETIDALRADLPNLPVDAKIRDCEGFLIDRAAAGGMVGTYAPYTVTYEVDRADLWAAKDALQAEVAAEVFPIDPAAVAITLKSGDYIEAESDDTKIGGKVSHVTERGFVAIEHLGEFAIHHITSSPLPSGYRMFALTAHQPAPEPEPEWEPGTVADITVHPGGVLRAVRARVGDYWAADTEEVYSDDDVESVRPLVVINPDDVDVEELSKAAWDRWDGQPATESSDAHFRDVIRVVLEHLGLTW
jgi:hypothetical protein